MPVAQSAAAAEGLRAVLQLALKVCGAACAGGAIATTAGPTACWPLVKRDCIPNASYVIAYIMYAMIAADAACICE
jgi:hypothetical protein